MKIIPIKTRLFDEGENLFRFIISHIKSLKEDSLVIITSKIVALSENRVVAVTSSKTKEGLIKKESDWAKRTKYTWLTVKDGMFMAASGIDESNANGKLILLPEDSFSSASRIRSDLMAHYRVKKLGVVITDSRTLPLRRGVIGIALGYCGFRGLRDYRGTPDLFGRKFRYSMTNVADSIAASGVLVLGEGDESCPLALVTEAPVIFTSRTKKDELFIELKDDMFFPLFGHLYGLKKYKKK